MRISKIETKKYGTNCYLLDNENSAVVIDPGEISDELINFCENNKHKEHRFILLTHCHFDHIGGVERVKEFWSCPVVASKADEKGLVDNSINLSGYWTSQVISIKPDITVKNDDRIKLGDEEISVIETPGHTVGSVCYLLEDTLFSGDTLFKMSIGRTDLPTADYNSMLESLRMLLELDADIRVLPGHGPETTIGFETKNNPYM